MIVARASTGFPSDWMVELGGYVRNSQSMAQTEFERAYPAPVLLVDRSEFDSAGNVSFDTVVVSVRKDDGPQGVLVFPVAKNRNNPWPERISIGRARNCDVVLRHASVSKLHAHFFLEDSNLVLADAKSTNGCRVNDRPLEPGERVPLSCGDAVCLGMIEATLYTPAGLFRFVQEKRVPDPRQAKVSQPPR